MSETIEGYFERLAQIDYHPLLHRVTGTLRFDVEESTGSHQVWRVAIDHGKVHVRRETGSDDDVDCTLSGREEEFQRILVGEDSYAAAFVRGALTVHGDYTLVQNVRRFSPPALVII